MLLFAISTGGAVALAAVGILVLIGIGGLLRPMTRHVDRISERGDYIGEPPGFKKPPDEGRLL